MSGVGYVLEPGPEFLSNLEDFKKVPTHLYKVTHARDGWGRHWKRVDEHTWRVSMGRFEDAYVEKPYMEAYRVGLMEVYSTRYGAW